MAYKSAEQKTKTLPNLRLPISSGNVLHRFIFEGVGFGVSAASTVGGYLCLCRFLHSIAQFYRRLEKEK